MMFIDQALFAGVPSHGKCPTTHICFYRRRTMKRTSIAALVAALLCAVLAAAQDSPQVPKPAPELQKLNYFNGTWKMEGDMKPSPFGPGGKFTGTEHNEWMAGKFFLVSHST